MGDSLGLSAEEVLMTTRSVRKRLDLERPVDRQTVIDCIEIAHQAPTGSDRKSTRLNSSHSQQSRMPSSA